MDIANLEGFLWDKGNAKKNWNKHRVLDSECEGVFFQQPILIEEDIPHSKNELHYFLLGQTGGGRLLFVVCTIRQNMIRVISARDMNRKERGIYAKATAEL
jgi:uncharacterized DUF497 family protein